MKIPDGFTDATWNALTETTQKAILFDSMKDYKSPQEVAAIVADERKWSEELASDLCKMEDALGFKNDQHDKEGGFIPTIGPWMERIRDLIAAEGEVGDLKAQLTAHTEALKVKLEPTLSLLADLFEVSEPPLTDRIWEELKRLKTL